MKNINETRKNLLIASLKRFSYRLKISSEVQMRSTDLTSFVSKAFDIICKGTSSFSQTYSKCLTQLTKSKKFDHLSSVDVFAAVIQEGIDSPKYFDVLSKRWRRG
ncbi:MAG: hypothetical protein R3A13_02515 [Bdellovibrionota bacterium]